MPRGGNLASLRLWKSLAVGVEIQGVRTARASLVIPPARRKRVLEILRPTAVWFERLSRFEPAVGGANCRDPKDDIFWSSLSRSRGWDHRQQRYEPLCSTLCAPRASCDRLTIPPLPNALIPGFSNQSLPGFTISAIESVSISTNLVSGRLRLSPLCPFLYAAAEGARSSGVAGLR